MSANGLQATYSLKICLTLSKPGSCLFRGLRELKPSFYRSDRSHCFWVSYTEEILPTWLPKWLLFSCIEPTWKLLDQTSELHCLVCVSDSSQNQMSQRKMQYLNLYKKQFWNNTTMARWTSLFLTPFFQKHNFCCLKILAHNRIQWWYISKGYMLYIWCAVLDFYGRGGKHTAIMLIWTHFTSTAQGRCLCSVLATHRHKRAATLN